MTISSELLPGVPLIESPLFQLSLKDIDLTDEQREIAVQLNERGYAVLDFPDDAIDARIDRIKASLAPRFDIDFTSKDSIKNKGSARIQDAWQFDEDVRAIAANSEILSLLSKLYGRRAFPFQTLNFPVGTQQHMHSDAVHFSSIPERFMCGVWLAMEDVGEDAGPLLYYPGSHKWPLLSNDMLGRRGYDNRTSSAQAPYEAVWRAMVDEQGLQPETFVARKGQCVIWMANLLHGGLRRNDPALTRWSQVTHYYFEDCIYYTPAFSDEPLGELDLRSITDIESGAIEPNRYLGKEIHSERSEADKAQWYRSILRSLKPKRASSLPADFDEERYYRLNRDVAAAQVDARSHYLKFGRKEGRRYK